MKRVFGSNRRRKKHLKNNLSNLEKVPDHDLKKKELNVAEAAQPVPQKLYLNPSLWFNPSHVMLN